MPAHPLYGYGPGESIAQLIMQRGNIAANRARQSGDVWGSALQSIGQQIGGAMQQHAAEKKEKEAAAQMAARDAAWTQDVESWDGSDPNAIFAAASKRFDPKTAITMAQAAVSFRQIAGKGDEKDLEHTVNVARAIGSGKISDPQLERWGPGLQAKLEPIVTKLFGEPAIAHPDKMTSEEATAAANAPWTPQQIREGAAAVLAIHGKSSDPMKVGKDDRLYDPDTKKMIVDVVPEQPKAPTYQHMETADGIRAFNPQTGEVGQVIAKGKPTQAAMPSFQAKEIIGADSIPVMANFDARTGRYTDANTGASIKNPRPIPSAEETKDVRKFKQSEPILNAVSDLSEKINTLEGVYAKAAGEVDRQKAKANLNDDIAEYEALISGFTPLVARALGHTGVLTEQDVQSVKALFPRPGDSKSLRDRKIARIKGIIGELEGGGAAITPAAGAAPAKVGRFSVEVE